MEDLSTVGQRLADARLELGDATAAARRAAIEAFKQGNSISSIASSLGVTRQTVYDWTR